MANHSPRTSVQNTHDISLVLHNEVIGNLRMGANVLSRLEALLYSIRDCAESGTGHQPKMLPSVALSRIQELADLGSYVAADYSGLLDVGRETFELEHLPIILASVSGGVK